MREKFYSKVSNQEQQKFVTAMLVSLRYSCAQSKVPLMNET